MKDSKKMYKVFVYGTLKRGEGNHRLLEESKFIGNDVLKGFKLYDLPYGFPCVVKSNSNDDEVSGEVYEVDSQTLERLNILEGYCEKGFKYNHYDRLEEKTILDNNVFVYVYTETPDNGTLIKDGCWTKYIQFTDAYRTYFEEE